MEKTREEYLKELKEEYEKKMSEINTHFDLQKDVNQNNMNEHLQYDEENIKSDDNFQEYQPIKKGKWRTVLIYIMLFLLPIFVSLSIISTHTNYLVRKPFDLICMGLSGILTIGILVLLIINVIKRDKKKSLVKYILSNCAMVLIVGIIDVIILYFLVKKKAWGMMNYFIAHYKIIALFLLICLILIIGLIVILKIKKRKVKNSIKMMFLNFIVCVYVLCFMDGILVLYRSQNFREWLITTAMQTMNHQYLCKWFYGEKEIKAIMDLNTVVESGESTDASLIDKQEIVEYANEYEKEILERDKDADYKIINLDVNGCKGYLAAVYDPTTVHLLVTDNVGVSGQYVTTMAKNNGAVLAINGGGFYDPGNSSTGGSPSGITISEGKVITRGEYGIQTQSGGIIGFDQEGILHLLKDVSVDNALNLGIQHAITWGPFLIVNGEKSFIRGNGGWGYAARTAIGQRKDGIVLFLVVDSNETRTNGADMVDLAEIMYNYGAINAANLDGGTSSVMVENGELISDPIDGGLRHQTRAIADAFGVIPKPKEQKEVVQETNTKSTKAKTKKATKKK